MSTAASPTAATLQFVDDMTAAGAPAHIDGDRILYGVLAVGGALNGQMVTTGVSVAEVQSWPMVPPHWIHLPAEVSFETTNTDATDCPPGWLRHSREFTLTDTSTPPALAWLRHVRGFISSAVIKAA